MKTEVVMKRELFGKDISQKSQSEYFSATDLVNAGNRWRVVNGLSLFNLAMWLKKESTLEFTKELEKQFGQVVVKGRGRNSATWVHPFLFIDIALAISPTLKIEVYAWLYDHLLKYRNNSGDSYKKMAGSLFIKHKNKSEFPKYIMTVANKIKIELKVADWNSASEDDLAKRDRIHENIALLCDVLPIDEAVRLGIRKGLT